MRFHATSIHETRIGARLSAEHWPKRSAQGLRSRAVKHLKKKLFLAPQARAQLLPASPFLARWDSMQRSALKARCEDFYFPHLQTAEQGVRSSFLRREKRG